MEKKLLLIDGHSILNRTFYGLPDLTNSEGLHTNAVYGFLNILFKLIDEHQPDYLVVAFDVHAPTFRHDMYSKYKGTRKPMPEELRQQVPLMKEVLDRLTIYRYEQAGLEADDILGTLAKRGERDGMLVTLVSGDRDLLQIATDKIMISIPKTKGGRTEVENYYSEDVKRVYDITPSQVIDLKALMGDTADNIPGVPRVGEKTAKALIADYETVDGVYEHLDEIKRASLKQTLADNKELCELSRKLATINTECDIGVTAKQAELGNIYTTGAYEEFQRLGFKNLLGKFDKSVTEVKADLNCNETSDLARAEEIFSMAQKHFKTDEKSVKDSFTGYAVIENDTPSREVIGIAISFDDKNAYFIRCEGFITADYLAEHIKKISKLSKMSIFDIKSSYHFFDPYEETQELASEDRLFDTLIAAYILNPLKNDYAPEDIALEHLGMTIKSKTQYFGKEQPGSADIELITEYACYLAYTAHMAAPVLEKKLEQEEMLSLYRSMEMPISYVLYDMEKNGIIAKRDELRKYSDKLKTRIDELEVSIYKQAGTEFNINSPKQLGEILFERLQLQGGKKNKTGYSTAADVLEKLAPDNPIVSDILEYRGLTKLKSTYADGLAGNIGDDGRIHTTYNQTIAATGRLSSTNPNLQNIPMRTELGRLIRKVFVPKDGYIFSDADYSQIELRILAHMSGDEGLIQAYHEGKDIHRITASKVFNTPFDDVTPLQRRNAKAVNFGIVYGISSFGLSQDLSITRSEASQYMESYFKTYPGVRQYQDSAVESAKRDGYAITLFGRRRPMPELKSSNFMQRKFGERVAMNAPIQGTAADIMKIAMISVWNSIRSKKLNSRLIMQIHDELVIETDPAEQDIINQILTDGMMNAANLAVPLEIDCHTGNDLYEAKG